MDIKQRGEKNWHGECKCREVGKEWVIKAATITEHSVSMRNFKLSSYLITTMAHGVDAIITCYY